jgi:integrase
MEIVQPIRNRKVIEQFKESLTDPRNKLMFIIGINSGLRISDILPLKVADLRGKTSLTIREEKTGKSKTFRFNSAITSAISELLPQDAADGDYVFQSRKGANKPLTRIQAYRILNSAAERVGITESIGCHTLRKTFGYHAYKAGVDLTLLQSIFNHSAQSVTLRYIGITQDNVDAVYDAINL